MFDINGNMITEGVKVKYSFNENKIPVFTGKVITRDNEFYIEHSNRVTIKLDDEVKYIEIIKIG